MEILNLAAKAVLVGMLAYSVAGPDLRHLAGKAMTVRALLYPLAALLVPIGWWALGSSGLQLTYSDTIGDLGLSLAGSLAGALLAARLAPGP